MLPVELARSYQDIVWHLLDEIQRLQLENIKLRNAVEQANLNAHGKESKPCE